MHCIIQNLLFKIKVCVVPKINSNPVGFSCNVRLESPKQRAEIKGILWHQGSIQQIVMATEIENCQLLTQHQQVQCYFTASSSELFLVDVWHSLWMEHGDKCWKGTTLSVFDWWIMAQAGVCLLRRSRVDGINRILLPVQANLQYYQIIC